ncbi:MAG: hypothetical protein AAF581_13630, partial [Planctomycetota bacterium]
ALQQVFGPPVARLCLRAFDANADQTIDFLDPLFTLQALFGGGDVHSLLAECVYGDSPGPLPCNGGPACP